MPGSAPQPPAPRDGSSLYYALRLTDTETAQRIRARLWLQQSISDAFVAVSDLGVAHRKRDWWQTEIEKLYSGSARHPAAIAVQQTGAGDAALSDAWLGVLSAATDRRISPADTQSGRDAALRYDWRARLCLLRDAMQPITVDEASLVNDTDSLPDDSSDTLALGIGLSLQLRALPALLRTGDPVFGSDSYRRFGASPDTLTPPALLLREQVDRAATCLLQARQRWNAAGAHHSEANLRPLRVYTRLREAQLALWQRSEPDLTRELRVLTPLRKLLIAWRTR